MPESTPPAVLPAYALSQARQLVERYLVDDLTGAELTDDLRDYGLDSIRLMSLWAELRARGAVIEHTDLAASPTLATIASALA